MKSWIGAASVLIVGLSVTAASAQSGDAARGQRVFNLQCKACHTLEKDGASVVGPNLHGVFGRKAGTATGFEFSEAMKKSGIVWDDATIADYNRDPKGKVPDTKMVLVSGTLPLGSRL